MRKLILIQIVIFISINNYAYAYLDPGTGSFILQILAVVLASIATFFKFFYEKSKEILKKIKNFFLNLFKKFT